MSLKVEQIGNHNADGFAKFSIKHNNKSIATFSASTGKQKGFEGNTLRIRNFIIYRDNNDIIPRLVLVFSALFNWNTAKNIKFLLLSTDQAEIFSMFGELFKKNNLIESMESHAKWVIYRNINQ